MNWHNCILIAQIKNNCTIEAISISTSGNKNILDVNDITREPCNVCFYLTLLRNYCINCDWMFVNEYNRRLYRIFTVIRLALLCLKHLGSLYRVIGLWIIKCDRVWSARSDWFFPLKAWEHFSLHKTKCSTTEVQDRRASAFWCLSIFFLFFFLTFLLKQMR